MRRSTPRTWSKAQPPQPSTARGISRPHCWRAPLVTQARKKHPYRQKPYFTKHNESLVYYITAFCFCRYRIYWVLVSPSSYIKSEILTYTKFLGAPCKAPFSNEFTLMGALKGAPQTSCSCCNAVPYYRALMSNWEHAPSIQNSVTVRVPLIRWPICIYDQTPPKEK